MWFGLLHMRSEDGDPTFTELEGAPRVRPRDTPAADVDEHVIVIAYEQRRLFKVATTLAEVPTVLTFLRAASDGGRNYGPPRCGCCDTPLEVPPVEEECECA